MSIAARFLLLCVAVLTFPPIAASFDSDRDGFIRVDAGLLSVTLEKAALRDVLHALGEQTGARVSIQGNLGNVQSQVFSGIPLDDGIKRLVQNCSADLVMIYNRDKAGYRYLAEIRAYEGNRNSRTSLSHSPTSVPPPLPVWLRHRTSVPRFIGAKFRARRHLTNAGLA